MPFRVQRGQLAACAVALGVAVCTNWAHATHAGNQGAVLTPPPKVLSPDRKWWLTVWKDREYPGSPWWLIVQRVRTGASEVQVPYDMTQVWPVSRYVYVLWRPDSRAFAFTDARFADRQFLLVDDVPGYTAAHVTDLTPVLEARFSALLGKRYDLLQSYVKPLAWLRGGLLLVGVNVRAATSAGEPRLGREPLRVWYRAYVVDVGGKRILQDLSVEEVQRRFSIDLANQSW